VAEWAGILVKTPRTRIYITQASRGQDFVLRIATREGGKCRATQVRSYFLSISPFSRPIRSGLADSASRPRRRRNDGDGDAHEFGHGERERFSRFTTARGLLVHRESPFSPSTGPMRDVDGQRRILLTRRSPRYCERARPVRGRSWSLASRASARTRLTPVSVDLKLALSRFYRWDALISRSFS